MGLGLRRAPCGEPAAWSCARSAGSARARVRRCRATTCSCRRWAASCRSRAPRPGTPPRWASRSSTSITGLHAVYGILAALRHRDATGEGQHVEVNLLSSLLSALVNQASAYVAGGVVPGILGNDHPSITPYGVYATADRPIVLAVGNDGQFRALCSVLGVDLAADDALRDEPRAGRPPQRAARGARGRARDARRRPLVRRAHRRRRAVRPDQRRRGGVRPRGLARPRPRRRGAGQRRAAGGEPAADVGDAAVVPHSPALDAGPPRAGRA